MQQQQQQQQQQPGNWFPDANNIPGAGLMSQQQTWGAMGNMDGPYDFTNSFGAFDFNSMGIDQDWGLLLDIEGYGYPFGVGQSLQQ